MKKIVYLVFALFIVVPTIAFSQQQYYWEYYTQNGVRYKKKVFIRETSRAYIPPREDYVPPVNYNRQNYWDSYYSPTQYSPQPVPVFTADQGLGTQYYNSQSFYGNYGYGNMNYYRQRSPAVIVIDLERIFRRRQY